MILCSVSLTNMAALLSALLILSGLSGIQIVTAGGKFSVEAGRSFSIRCSYELWYANNVKYLCEGYNWLSCDNKIKSRTTSRSGVFSISDNKQLGFFTVTIDAKTAGTYYYWCAVEVDNARDRRFFFELSVTKAKPKTTTYTKTSPSTLRPVDITPVPTVESTVNSTVNTSVNTTGQNEPLRTSSLQLTVILPVIFDILMLVVFFLIIWTKNKKTKTPSSAAAVAEEEATYNEVLYTIQTSEKLPEHSFMELSPDQDVFTVAEFDLDRCL